MSTDVPRAKAHVITVSTRCAAGKRPDASGPVVVTGLRALGWSVNGPQVVPDAIVEISEAIRVAVASGHDLVVTTGGTGLTPDDVTPEATAAVLDREVPGIADAIRAAGIAAGVPTAALSRGIAGVTAGTLVVNVGGSPGAAADGVAYLAAIVDHAVAQLRGGDHSPRNDSND